MLQPYIVWLTDGSYFFPVSYHFPHSRAFFLDRMFVAGESTHSVHIPIVIVVVVLVQIVLKVLLCKIHLRMGK